MIIPTHSTKKMVPITAPVSAAAVVTYKSVRCPITTICAGWAAAQVNNGTQPGACSDETKRCLAGSSSYSYEYYRAAAVLCSPVILVAVRRTAGLQLYSARKYKDFFVYILMFTRYLYYPF